MKSKIRIFILLIICFNIMVINVGCKKNDKKKTEEPKSIKIVCEDTVFPMVNDLARDYNLNSQDKINLESIDREEAFDKLYNSQTEILVGYVQPENKEIEAEMLGYDGIGIIVNKNNQLESLSLDQLRKIYTGNILNWENLNGSSKDIIPIAYKNIMNSVQKEFNMKVMDTPVKEQMTNTMKYASSLEEMKNNITEDKNSIGFVPGQWYNKDIKFLRLNGIELTVSNLKNELYPLRFPIKIYYSKEKKEELKDVLQYLKSDDGKKIIRKYCIEAF